MDINTVAENLTELLTNSVNMTSVFYDLFINPTPKDVTLKQYNDDNKLVDVVLPNRAKDRQICLSGTVSPEGNVVGNVGECYVNTVREEVWFKVKNSGQNTGWILALTEGSVTTLLTNYVQKSRKINGKALSSDITLTASDVGALPTGTSYGYSLEFAGVNLSLKDKNGTNLSTVPVASVGANRDLSNLTDLGNKKVVPSQDGASGKFLTTDGTNTSWGSVSIYHPPILSSMWSDHLINDIQWLRSDTFSWQSGDVYKTVYDKLVEEYATGTEETEGSITFKRTSNGFKIATSSYESAILDKYNNDGIAWYYILDTTNKRFKLPRCKYKYWKRFNASSTLPVKGNGKTLGLTDGTTNFGLSITANSENNRMLQSGYYNSNVGTGTNNSAISGVVCGNYTVGLTTDSSKSGVIADASLITADIEETGFYLHFYVGEYSQTAVEQTAGLNAELFNSKLDLNASGLSTQGKSYISGLGMPSGKYIDLTLGASGSTYTTPANGWVNLNKSCNGSGQFINIFVNDVMWSKLNTGLTTAHQTCLVAPVKKGDIIKLEYSATGNTNYFRFYYAEGSQP